MLHARPAPAWRTLLCVSGRLHRRPWHWAQSRCTAAARRSRAPSRHRLCAPDEPQPHGHLCQPELPRSWAVTLGRDKGEEGGTSSAPTAHTRLPPADRSHARLNLTPRARLRSRTAERVQCRRRQPRRAPERRGSCHRRPILSTAWGWGPSPHVSGEASSLCFTASPSLIFAPYVMG